VSVEGGTQPPRLGSWVAVGVFVALLAFTVALMVFSIPAGAYSVLSGRLSTTAFNSSTIIYPYFWIGPLLGIIPVATSPATLFVALTGLYVLFLAYGIWQGVRPWRAVADAFRSGIGSLLTSPFIVMIVSIVFLTFTASIIDSVTSSAGVPIGGVSGAPLDLLLGFTLSPLVEEIGFRMVLIGFVAFILSVGRPWRDTLGAVWRPSRVLEGAAFGGGASVIIWAATGLSAVTFGACHVVCGGTGWQIGKFPEAAYGGLVLGYLYVRYGFHVAVIAHWGIDYFGSALAFFGQAAYGIPWNSSTTEYFGQYLVDIDVLFLFGLASFLLVVYLGVKKWAARRGAPADGYIPPAEGAVVQT
jgi:membrane protease YdiL (CAAX protease family)